MRITEAIKKLQEILEKKGDIHLVMEEDGYGGEAKHIISDICSTTMYATREEMEENCVDEDTINEFIGSGNINDLYDVVMIYTGDVISVN